MQGILKKIHICFLKILFGFIALLPLNFSRFIGALAGDGYYFICKKRVHIARVNVGLCFPNLSAVEQEAMVRESIRCAGKWFFEAGAMWFWPEKKLLGRVRTVNEHLLHEALACKRGVILAVPHLGNWEVMGPFISQFETFSCFYKVEKTSTASDEFILQQRSNRGSVMASSDAKGIRKLYKSLKSGGVIGMLPDHNPKRSMGVFAPFFGIPALTGTLISSLAKKNNAHVLTAVVFCTDKGFDIHFGSVPDQDSDDEIVAATAINKAIESCITMAPEQYQWVYPRFKTRPIEGELSPYK